MYVLIRCKDVWILDRTLSRVQFDKKFNERNVCSFNCVIACLVYFLLPLDAFFSVFLLYTCAAVICH